MKLYATRNVLGVFAIDGEGKLVEFIPFHGSPSEIGEMLSRKEPLEEKRMLSGKYSDSQLEFEVESGAAPPNAGGEHLRANLDRYLELVGIDRESYTQKLREVCFSLAREGAKRALSEKDKVVIQVVRALDDLTETLNLLSERLRSWYSLHYPELSPRVEEHEEYARLVARYGKRENFPGRGASIGVDITGREEEMLKSFARSVAELYGRKKKLEEFLDRETKAVAPNLRYLVGSALAARLIAMAGGLRALAFMPASRIQLLGAEKALFRHLRRKAKPPKHGIIFQLPAIKSSPRKLRGRLARSIASVLAMAARVDAFSGEFKGEELKARMERRTG